MFDTVMPYHIVAHTYEALSRCKSLEILVTSRNIQELLRELGFWRVTALPCAMCGSSEGKTMYFYRRKPLSMQCSGMFGNPARNDGLEKAYESMLHGNREQTLAAYEATRLKFVILFIDMH